MGPSAADEAKTGAHPAQRRNIQRIRIDAALAGDEELDRAPLAFEAKAAFDAAAPLRVAVPAAVDADETNIAARHDPDPRPHRHAHVDAAVGLPAVVDVR